MDVRMCGLYNSDWIKPHLTTCHIYEYMIDLQ